MIALAAESAELTAEERWDEMLRLTADSLHLRHLGEGKHVPLVATADCQSCQKTARTLLLNIDISALFERIADLECAVRHRLYWRQYLRYLELRSESQSGGEGRHDDDTTG